MRRAGSGGAVREDPKARLSIQLAAFALVLYAATAHADTGAWNGYRGLGVPDAQLAALGYVTAEGMRQGGLVGDVVLDEAAARTCGIQVECHCAALRKRGLRYGAFGSLGHLGDLWTIELTLIDAHDCTVVTSAFASESLGDGEVAPRLAGLARRLATPAGDIAETATGNPRIIDTTPAVVTTFTRAQLRALQIRTLDELLPLVPGYEVVEANWGGAIVAQGLQNTQLFLSNGVPLVNVLTNFRALGRDFRASLVHVDRIEIVRGPGAVLWGQNAFLGVINLITETPTRRAPIVDAGITAGTLDTTEVWARGGENRGRYAFSISIAGGRRVGATTDVPDSPQAVIGVPAPPFGNGGTTHPAADRWLEVLVRLAIGKHVELDFQNLTSEVNFEISPLGPLLDEGAGGYWKKTHRLYGATVTRPLLEQEGATVTGRARLSRYELYSDENFAVQPLWPDGPEPTPEAPRDLRLGLRSLQGNAKPRAANQLDARAIYDYENGIRSELTAGLNVLHQYTPASQATLTGIEQDPVRPSVSFHAKHFVTLSAFALEELVPVPWLVMSVGARLRLDRPYREGDSWRLAPSFQGGAAVKRGRFGAKLIYAEGYRPPDAVQLFSTVGTKGNPDLVPESSRALALEAHASLSDDLVVRAGGDVTRASDVIVLDPIAGDPNFAYTPINKGRIDIASGYVGAQLTTARAIDAFASYHATAVDESDPLGTGIPVARHTAALGAVWRPLADLSLFARATFASPRRLNVLTPDGPRSMRTRSTLHTALGGAITDVFAGLDLEVAIDNPVLREFDAPYRLDGTTAPLVERRRGTEVFATLRYDR